MKKGIPSLPTSTQLIVTIGLTLIAAVATAIGCAWPGTSHSVRFNAYQTEREMQRLPPLPTMANGMNEARAYWDIDEEPIDDSPYVDPAKEVDALWDRAEAAEKDGNLRLDRELLSDYLKRTQAAREGWTGYANRQERRNSAMDRLDAMTALNHGSNASPVKAYLEARHLHDTDKPVAEEITRALNAVPNDANLRDNVTYLRAAELYRQNKFEEAARAFVAMARLYPHSEKREAALFVAAVATMKTSIAYVPASGNSYGVDDWKKASTDQAWRDAFAAFQKVIDEYPHGKYFNDARAWQAYLRLRAHDRAAALAQYYRLLGDSHDENARTEAAFSLTMVRSSATDDEMTRVEQELANEPQAALAYAYHNVYNYSIDPGPAEQPYNEEQIKDTKGQVDYDAERRRDETARKDWDNKRADIAHKELGRTLEFSKRLIANYPNLSVGGAFALRAAQASEELDDNNAALQFAHSALQSRLGGDERAQALWTLGVAENRLHHFGAARKSFSDLVHDYPKSELIEGARRELAMIAEDSGDIDAALEQYIALDYRVDEAYLVDYLMTPKQLAAFIQEHPDSPRRNEFTYALGVRYLRENQWDDARKILAQVRTDRVDSYNYYCSACNCDGNKTVNCNDPKVGDFDVHENETVKKQIPPALIMRDVQTANDLEALARAPDRALGDEAKAEALYQYASYQYEASSLLFYNPLASPGYYNLGEFAGEGKYRASGESQILFAAQEQHDRLARALKIYLQVADQFPHTRAARDALYTSAVCHERLSNYNPYWRNIYEHGLHAGERMVTYADVKATYPNYQMPRGTYGWQPSTRTVNNGPGWATAPKPPPRLTKRERLKLFNKGFSDLLTSFWAENGKRWLTEILIVLGLVFTFRIARRNRRRLRARLARQRIEQAKQIVSYPWYELFWIDPVQPSRRQRVNNLLREKRQEFIDLARDRRGRPVLFRSMLSYSVMTGLLLSLIRTLWFG
ncbi:MAG: outer membrane protein assembly factor BamD [Pyrinomonadaceae bacterium]